MTVDSAQPKNSAKIISATISPEKALAAESIGFCGSRSTMYWYHILPCVAVTFFWMLSTPELLASAALSKARPTPGLRTLVMTTAMMTAQPLSSSVYSSDNPPTLPRPAPRPSSIVPSINAERISGTTTMKIMRRKVAPRKVMTSLNLVMKVKSLAGR